MTLTEFLLARIAEDGAAAHDCWEPDYVNGPEPGTWFQWVLAECEAKRQRVALLAPLSDRTHGLHQFGMRLLKVEALPYVGHPDYRDEWRP
jgi:hypothetical protein